MTGRTTACAIAAATLASLSACGDDPSPRTQVRSYLMAVNAVQGAMAARFETASTAYVAFSRGDLTPDVPAATSRLASAAEAIRAGRARVQAIKPPPQARPVHRQLLEVYDRNVALAEETVSVVKYQRSAAAPLEDVAGYDRALSRALARGSAAAQGRALRRFARRIDTTRARLRALDPPALLEPSHHDRIKSLDGARSRAISLRAALRSRDSERLARLLVRFRRSESRRRTSSGPARRAVRAYNRRVAELRTAYTDLRRAQEQLSRALD